MPTNSRSHSKLRTFFQSKNSKKPLRRRLAMQELEDRRVLATFTVTNLADAGAGSLRQAILDANAGGDPVDNIEFQSGLSGTITLTSGEIPITGGLNINGPGSDALSVSGNNSARIFMIDDANAGNLIDVQILGVTLTGGNASGAGGAILSQESLTLNSTTVTGNTATGNGGGIAAYNGTTTVVASVLDNNITSGPVAQGGAIHSNSAIVVTNSTFSNNTVTGLTDGVNSVDIGGGAISGAGDITVAGSNLENNLLTFEYQSTTGSLAARGGAIRASGGTVTVDNSTILNNRINLTGNYGVIESVASVYAQGGAVQTETSDVLITGSRIRDNGTNVRFINTTSGAVALEGGAVRSASGAISVTDSILSVNRMQASTVNGATGVTLEGGGVRSDTGNLSVSGSLISGNRLAAFQVTTSADLTVRGGGISGGAKVSIQRSEIGENYSFEGYGYVSGITRVQGGGVWNDDGTVGIDSSTIYDNYLRSPVAVGGGVHLNSSPGNLTITHSTVSGNSTQGSGGGISIQGGALMASYSTIAFNRADFAGFGGHDGGGILVGSGGTALLQHTIVAQNLLAAATDDVAGTFDGTSQFNLIGNGDGSVGLTNGVSGNQVGAAGSEIDPMLGALADNGGLTRSHTLLPGSPAIDAGDPAFVTPPDVDQRLAPFARVADGGNGLQIDIGALEWQSLPFSLVVTTADDELDVGFDASDLSLREAISIANGSFGADTITFDTEGVFSSAQTIYLQPTLGEMAIADALTITAPAEVVTIDAQRNSRHFNIGDGNRSTLLDVEIDGLTLTQGYVRPYASPSGGGAIMSFENLALRNAIVTDSSASSGGAVRSLATAYESDSPLHVTIEDSHFSGNVARNSSGGAISIGAEGAGDNSSNTINITNVVVTGNTAGRDGGGIHFRFDNAGLNSTVTKTLRNVTVTGNMAGDSGGGLSDDSDTQNSSNGTNTLIIEDSKFSGNRADDDGGGIELDMDSFDADNTFAVFITRVNITGNTAGVDSSSFDTNGGDGGGISSDNGARDVNTSSSVTITDSMISGNTALSGSAGDRGRGGGLYADITADDPNSAESLIVRNTSIFDNYAQGAGGGVSLNARTNNLQPTATNTTSIIDSDVRGNRAAGPGGGVYNVMNAGASLTISGGAIHRNETIAAAGHGAGLYNTNDDGGSLTVTGTVFESNANRGTSVQGVAIHNRNVNAGSFDLTDVKVINNGAFGSADGVGLFNANLGGGATTIAASLFADNSSYATTRGGGIFNNNTDGGSLTIQQTTITGNDAQGSGGGLFHSSSTDGGSLTVHGSTISDNYTATNNSPGGGVYILNVGTSTATITGTTISANRTFLDNSPGGGIHNVNRNGGATTITGGTITDNWAYSYSAAVTGGGLSNLNDGVDGSAVSGVTELRSTIIADNLSGGPEPDISTFSANGGVASVDAQFSLIGNVDTATVNTVGGGSNQLGAPGATIDPLLGPLGDNGGPTETHLLMPGSPAIDAGSAFAVLTDHRGFVRTADIAGIANAAGGDGTDIGATEGRLFFVDELGDSLTANATTSIREAINASNELPDGDRIEFNLPVMSVIQLDDGELPVAGHLVIDGPHADLLSIDALGLSRIFNISDNNSTNLLDVSIRDLTLTGGNGNGNGGAIYAQENLSISDSILSGNSASGTGGALYVHANAQTVGSASRLTILYSDFINNQSVGDGGAIDVESNANGDGSSVTVQIQDSTIAGNTASGSIGDGGGLYLDIEAYGYGGSSSVEATLIRVSVTGNHAGRKGGGLASDMDVGYYTTGSSKLLIVDSHFDNNRSADDGGGLYLENSGYGTGSSVETTIRRTTVIGNSAGGSGGGIADDDSVAFQSSSVSMLLDQVTLSGNTAQIGGGGLYTNAGGYGSDSTVDITIIDSTISGNTARLGAGGGVDNRIYAYTNSSNVSMTVKHSAIDGNYSGTNGGGAALAMSNAGSSSSLATKIENTTISGNSANGSGGGFFSNSNGTFTVTSSTIHANTADATGAGYSASGGGIHVASGEASLQNTIVAGNIDISGTAPDLDDAGQAVAANFSLIGDNTGSSLSESPIGSPDAGGNLVGGAANGVIDPLLGPLAKNGGRTRTHALLAASPARDAGNAFGIFADQRGGARSFSTDIGAFEGLHLIVNDTGDSNDGDPTNSTTTLREAIAIANAAETFDRITFDLTTPSTILRPAGGTELLVTNSLVIDGPGMDALTIDANGGVTGTRVMRMADSMVGGSSELVLRGVTLTGGAATGQSGGAVLTQENLSLHGVRINGNTATEEIGSGGSGSGGAIQMNANAVGIASAVWLEIENSTITGNTADSLGGGIQTHNTAVALGSRSVISIFNSTVDNNRATNDSGGGVDLNNDSEAPYAVSQITVANTVFQSNNAGFNGGAMDEDNDQKGYRSTALFTIEDSQFVGNSVAFSDGGGIRTDPDLRAARAAALVTIRDTSFTNNSASIDDGGALFDATDVQDYKARALFLLDNVQMTNNVADGGAGFFSNLDVGANAGRAVVMVRNSQFSGNTADDEGGGILTSIDAQSRGSQALSIVKNSTISDNLADQGGGFYMQNRASRGAYDGTTRTVILGTTISGNTAEDSGGGIYQDNDGTLSIAKTTISGNTAMTGAGGGIFVTADPGSLSIENSTITANSAATSGGGLSLADGRTATVLNTILSANLATTSDPDLSTGTDAHAALSFSLVGDVGSATVMDNGNNQIGVTGSTIDALLGPLKDNGGPTFTHAFLAGSPAVNAGNELGTTLDQRGVARPQGTFADIGAYELIPCDFDGDGDCDIDDLDLLIGEIASGNNNAFFDLTGDSVVDLADRDQWLANAGAINLQSMNPYLVADANLDGVVDGQDFLIWNDNKFMATGKWSQGDWNADGVTDGQDFLAWNDNKFQSSDSVGFLDRVFENLALEGPWPLRDPQPLPTSSSPLAENAEVWTAFADDEQDRSGSRRDPRSLPTVLKIFDDVDGEN